MAEAVTGRLVDSHGRVLRDLRISVTDRCNFRCLYCLPETEAAANFYQTRFLLASADATARITRQWQPHAQMLTFEEIERAARVAVGQGIEKIRLTGGEPLLRRDLEKLVAKIAAIPGVRDLALTSNGYLFAQKARALREAGLQRVSFSLDSLDRENFRKITGRDGLAATVASIDLARELGFSPVKVNAVIIRGINDHEIEALAAFGAERGVAFRFIEFMPLDSGRGWQRELVVSGAEILARLKNVLDPKPLASLHRSETARRWTMRDGRGEIGIIAPVTEPFCGHCNRLRLTADGKLRTCLFSLTEHDLRAKLRAGASDEEIAEYLRAVVWQKEARHHIGEREFVQPQRTMSCIGG
ncbi:MAG TPA: GTP 3',8-cyclase MoaA [Verrucomicrobiae bacterium]|jgi:cyclic pyranopterin phosphate synthase|nr:GTP 3',8-cyclase MoaA [Verrucomicrobiae bacterium]